MPHQQLSQNAPAEVQEALFARAKELPGVSVAASGISVPGARAFVLADEVAKGPPEAVMVGREFAHLHPPYDGSLHLALPADAAAEVERLGWGQLHPLARAGGMPPTIVMVFGPRDAEELETAWTILRASHAFASGV
jgi:phospholipase/carboxylesterase